HRGAQIGFVLWGGPRLGPPCLCPGGRGARVGGRAAGVPAHGARAGGGRVSALAPARGEGILRDATRFFSVRADQARTLKGLFLGVRASGPEPVPALQGVTLRIAPGETVGVVGRNGAGKTSTLRVLAGIIPLQSGEAACGGRVVSLLELGAGFSRD